MGFMDFLFGKSKDNNEEDNEEQIEKVANDSQVQAITQQQAEALGVPKASEAPKPLSEDQVEDHENSGGGSEEGPPSSLTVKPYEGEKEDAEETAEEETEEEQEGGEEAEDEDFLSRIQLGMEDEGEKKEAPKGDKIEQRKAIMRDVRSETRDNAEWKRNLHSSKYKGADGKQTDLFKSSALDKVQTGLDIGSGVTSLASSGTEMFNNEGFFGKKLGVSEGTSKKVDTATNSLSLASDTMALASGGISVYKDIQAMKENDEFTTDSEKSRQKLSLASNSIGMAGTVASMGSSISSLAGGSDELSAGFSTASNALGATTDTLDLIKNSSSLSENAKSRSQLEAAMNDGSSSEEFKKYAGVAMQAHNLQRTSAAFDTAKSATSLFGNVANFTKNLGTTLGVDKNSTTGKILGYIGTAGSVVSGIGSALGLVGTITKKLKKSSRKEENIDQFIHTDELKEKINNTKKYNLTSKDTRKVAKTVLGYKTSDEMFSAILLNYAATIRKNAENGSEKDKYRMLISGLGFKLEGNTGLPSVDAIAQKLSAADA